MSVESEMELFVRLVDSFRTLNIVTRSSILDIFVVLDLSLSLNLTAKNFGFITVAKLLSIKFVFMLVVACFLFIPFLLSVFLYYGYM